MNRKALIGWLLLQAAACTAAPADPQPAGSDVPRSGSAHDTRAADSSSERDAAIERARAALRAAGVDPSAMTLKSAQPITWPDSSLGCRRPGIQYLPVQGAGYRIELDGAAGNYVVHVAGKRAIVCAAASGGLTPLGRPLAPLRNIDVMTQRAKEMLAGTIHAPAAQIRVVRLDPQVWADTGLGCPSQSPPVAGRVTGFSIVLEHQGRAYTFNTDLHRVLACPPIDTQ